VPRTLNSTKFFNSGGLSSSCWNTLTKILSTCFFFKLRSSEIDLLLLLLLQDLYSAFS
jgi:hypothetical protein